MCQGNGNCSLDIQQKLDAELKALRTRKLIEKLRSELEESQSKKLDKKTESPQHKEGSGQDVVSQNSITEMVNTQTRLAPTLLNHRGGRASIVIQSGQTITIASIITLGATLFKASETQFLQILLFCLGFLGCIIILAGFFWDPDRPDGSKGSQDSEEKSQKQQNTDNNIDKRKKDDNMDNSIKVYEQIRKRVIAEQSKERLRIKIFLIENIEDLEFEELFSKYLKIRIAFYEDIIVSEISTEIRYSKIKQIYSLLYRMCYSIFVDLFCKTIIEKEKNINNYHQKFKLFTMETESEIYKEVRQSRLNSMTEKELMSLLKSRHLSEYNKVIKAFYQPLIRKFAEEINLQRDLKMSKERRKGINYATDDSFQLNKEKKNIYPTLTHHYLFHIPEIKRLSQNLSVTKENNILNHKFSFALQTNTNQCSTEDEQIQISITNNQKTKSNKLLRKKIKLNLN